MSRQAHLQCKLDIQRHFPLHSGRKIFRDDGVTQLPTLRLLWIAFSDSPACPSGPRRPLVKFEKVPQDSQNYQKLPEAPLAVVHAGKVPGLPDQLPFEPRAERSASDHLELG